MRVRGPLQAGGVGPVKSAAALRRTAPHHTADHLTFFNVIPTAMAQLLPLPPWRTLRARDKAAGTPALVAAVPGPHRVVVAALHTLPRFIVGRRLGFILLSHWPTASSSTSQSPIRRATATARRNWLAVGTLITHAGAVTGPRWWLAGCISLPHSCGAPVGGEGLWSAPREESPRPRRRPSQPPHQTQPKVGCALLGTAWAPGLCHRDLGFRPAPVAANRRGCPSTHSARRPGRSNSGPQVPGMQTALQPLVWAVGVSGSRGPTWSTAPVAAVSFVYVQSGRILLPAHQAGPLPATCPLGRGH
jgi:hypothetical protein